jgi:hypothetical protein
MTIFLVVLGLIKDFKIFVHGIPYALVTFTIIHSSVLNSNYIMLLGHPWLRDVVRQLLSLYFQFYKVTMLESTNATGEGRMGVYF